MLTFYMYKYINADLKGGTHYNRHAPITGDKVVQNYFRKSMDVDDLKGGENYRDLVGLAHICHQNFDFITHYFHLAYVFLFGLDLAIVSHRRKLCGNEYALVCVYVKWDIFYLHVNDKY